MPLAVNTMHRLQPRGGVSLMGKGFRQGWSTCCGTPGVRFIAAGATLVHPVVCYAQILTSDLGAMVSVGA